MGHEVYSHTQTALTDAQSTVARQAAEIERLHRAAEAGRLADELQQVLSWAAATGIVSSPVTHSRLLEMIVETAAHVISAEAASLFLIDHEAQELVFEIAMGQKADEVKKFRVPLGHGIAGLVAVSGQPMAISEARDDPRQAADIAQAIGYTPDSILCVPLFYNDEVIGVLELLDKRGALYFDAADMELLGLFANQAAVAIEQSLTHRNLTALVSEVLTSFGSLHDHGRASLVERARTFVAHTESSPGYRQSLQLARLVQEIAWHGEGEYKACHSVLLSFAEYLRARSELQGLMPSAVPTHATGASI